MGGRAQERRKNYTKSKVYITQVPTTTKLLLEGNSPLSGSGSLFLHCSMIFLPTLQGSGKDPFRSYQGYLKVKPLEGHLGQ